VKAIAITELTHNPFDKTRWVSGLRENFTSRSYGEGLETDRTAPRQSLTRQTFHKIMKSGCRAEQSKLRTAARLVNLLDVLRPRLADLLADHVEPLDSKGATDTGLHAPGS
jgi:hypothetical protein